MAPPKRVDPLPGLSKLQQDLVRLCHSLTRLRSVEAELASVTRRKPFTIRNGILWHALISTHRMLIIDVAAFGDAVGKWMVAAFRGDSLHYLSVSNRRANKLHPTRPTDEAVALLTKQLRYLFGAPAARRRAARQEDVEAFRDAQKERYTASLLKSARDSHAHRYNDPDSVESIGFSALARELRRCGRILNALRLLINCSTYEMPSLSAPRSRRGSHGSDANDLVDLLVLGDIREVAKRFGIYRDERPYLWERRALAYRRTTRLKRRAHA